MKKIGLKFAFFLISICHSFSYAEKIESHSKVDRFTGNSAEYYSITFTNKTLDGIESSCEKRCTLTYSNDSFYLDGYAALDPWKPTKEIIVRIRLANEFFNGKCIFTNEKEGCFATFTNLKYSDFVAKMKNFKGYFAVEVNQIFKKSEFRYEGQIQKSVWYADID
jgi:hypothetical protein